MSYRPEIKANILCVLWYGRSVTLLLENFVAVGTCSNYSDDTHRNTESYSYTYFLIQNVQFEVFIGLQGVFPEKSYFGAKHGHLRSFLGQKT